MTDRLTPDPSPILAAQDRIRSADGRAEAAEAEAADLRRKLAAAEVIIAGLRQRLAEPKEHTVEQG